MAENERSCQITNTVTAPDNEVVTTEYKGMGLPAKLTSGTTILVNGPANLYTGLTDAVNYDEARPVGSWLRQMKFSAGGNLWHTRTYHAWNGSSGNGDGWLWEIRMGTSATESANTNYNKLRLGYAYDSGVYPEPCRRGNISASSEQFSLGTWYQYRHCYACPELAEGMTKTGWCGAITNMPPPPAPFPRVQG